MRQKPHRKLRTVRRPWTHRAALDIGRRWKRYSLALALLIVSIPDVWVAIGDQIASMDFGYEGGPNWLPWAIRLIAIVIGTVHRLKKDSP